MSNQIVWEERTVKIKDLRPAIYNPRKFNKKAKDPFIRNLENYGNLEPIVVNQDMTIIGGHMRYNIFLEQGKEEVQVSYPNRVLLEDEEKKLNIILNSVSGHTNLPKLLTLGLSIDELQGLGFDELNMAKKKEVDAKPEKKEKNKLVYNLYFYRDDFFEVQRVIKQVQKDKNITSQAEAVLHLIKN